MQPPRLTWRLRDRTWQITKPLVMGIVNVTPDSFSDGGLAASAAAAISHGIELVRQGADILDIGGESSRPGAAPISLEEELARVIPVVRGLGAACQVPLSVDTTKAGVAAQAIVAGAHIINDISALQADASMARVLCDSGAGLILMHMQGTPATMQVNPRYLDVVTEVRQFLEARLQYAVDNGIAAEQVVLDPGIGFGKTVEHNLRLLARLEELQGIGRPILLGVSRKGFLGKILNRPLDQRLAGSLAAVAHGLAKRSIEMVRVHDVAPTRDIVDLLWAINQAHELRGGEHC